MKFLPLKTGILKIIILLFILNISVTVFAASPDSLPTDTEIPVYSSVKILKDVDNDSVIDGSGNLQIDGNLYIGEFLRISDYFDLSDSIMTGYVLASNSILTKFINISDVITDSARVDGDLFVNGKLDLINTLDGYVINLGDRGSYNLIPVTDEGGLIIENNSAIDDGTKFAPLRVNYDPAIDDNNFMALSSNEIKVFGSPFQIQPKGRTVNIGSSDNPSGFSATNVNSINLKPNPYLFPFHGSALDINGIITNPIPGEEVKFRAAGNFTAPSITIGKTDDSDTEYSILHSDSSGNALLEVHGSDFVINGTEGTGDVRIPQAAYINNMKISGDIDSGDNNPLYFLATDFNISGSLQVGNVLIENNKISSTEGRITIAADSIAIASPISVEGDLNISNDVSTESDMEVLGAVNSNTLTAAAVGRFYNRDSVMKWTPDAIKFWHAYYYYYDPCDPGDVLIFCGYEYGTPNVVTEEVRNYGTHCQLNHVDYKLDPGVQFHVLCYDPSAT